MSQMPNDPQLLAALRAASDSALEAARQVNRGVVDRVEPAIDTALSIDLWKTHGYDVKRVRSASHALAKVVLDVFRPEVETLTDRADLVVMDQTMSFWSDLIEGLSDAEVDDGSADDGISSMDARMLEQISSRNPRPDHTSIDPALALETSAATIISILLNGPYEIADSGGPNEAPSG